MIGPNDPSTDPNAISEVAAPPVVGPPIPEAISGVPDESDSVLSQWRWPVVTSATLCVVILAFIVAVDSPKQPVAQSQFALQRHVPRSVPGPVPRSVADTARVAPSASLSEPDATKPDTTKQQVPQPSADPFDNPFFDDKPSVGGDVGQPSEASFVAVNRDFAEQAEPVVDSAVMDPAGESTEPDEKAAKSGGNFDQQLVAVKAFKPLRTLKDPKLAEFGENAVCKDGSCAKTQSLGTTLQWAETPRDAYRMAAEQGKMVFLIHVSGNFEIPGFT